MKSIYLKEPEPYRIIKLHNVHFYAHFHEQAELVYCIEGTIHVTIEGLQYDLSEGEGAMIFPNQHHWYQHDREEPDSLCYILIVGPFLLDEYFQELTSMIPDDPILKKERMPSFLSELFEIFYQIWEKENDERMFKAYATVITGHVLSCMNLTQQKTSYGMNLTQTVLAYVDQHFKEHISLSSMSKQLGISKSALSHVFSEKFQTSFMSYVNKRRIFYAQKLLKSTEYTMKETAGICGFGSQRTFYRVFQEICGMTPGIYRKNIREKKNDKKQNNYDKKC